MALYIYEDGSIDIYQGDSGSIFVHNLNKDKNYKVYLGVQDKKRNFVFEKTIEANSVEFAEIKILPTDSQLLTVPLNKNFETYYYGVKVEEVGTTNSDTMFISNSTYGDLTEMRVYPKKAKGGILA
ncbi:MAG: hypothetical protein IKY15_02765 [Clostridia bacterium]|nr:hypothetical protein [Clostridia bacterium]